jgi:serine/threonine protein kinase
VSQETPAPRLGNYELLMLLASGGMANVYAARQVGAAGFQRLVVVKRVHSHLLEDRSFYDMFRDEAAMASLVRHPNVVPVTDVVESAGELFLVMDYIEGVALSTVLKSAFEANELVPAAIGSRIVIDALSGLHAAHEVVDMGGRKLELVHRDVSPHNILVGTDGIARLIDFGVAKAAHRSTQTRSGALKGKYPYMSPEHARGQPVDRRSDIFAAAIVLYETLTRKRLFHGENDLDTLRRVMEAPIPPSSSVVKTLPIAIDNVLRKALAREVDQRYQSAQDFLDGVEKALPPAPHRDVGAFVQRICSARLTERRGAIQALLDGRLQPLSVRQARSGDEVSRSHHVVRTDPPPGVTRAPGSGPRALTGPADPTLTEGEAKGTLITHDAPIPPPAEPSPRSRGRLVILGLLGAAAVAAGVVWMARPPTAGSATGPSTSAHTATTPPPTSQQPTASSAAPAADEVQLVLVADSPIESVRVAGTRLVEIDGTRARVRITRWTGPLPIDVVLARGDIAHAIAAEGTSGEVRLERVVVDAGAPSTGRSGQGKAVPKATPPTQNPSPGGPELHPSPYGN